MAARPKVLIIDDDELLRGFASDALEEGGYAVETAAEGAEGLRKASSSKPDLVLVDLMMPGLHGYDVCQRLRADKALAKTRILATSSKSYETDIAAAKKAGADAFLVKPYTVAALQQEVAELIGKPGPNGGGREADDSDTMTVRAGGDARISTGADPRRTDVTVRFWGTRGSSPAPGPDTVRYGGNTACTEVRVGDLLFIIDCGTGIRELGLSLLKEFGERPIEGHILVGHTHWDHIQGFPFFAPLYLKRNKFNLYSVRGSSKSLERVFRGQMATDYFPVPLNNLASDIHFVEVEGPFHVGPVTVRYHFLNHPGVAIGFRLEAFGKSVAYVSDHEGFARLNGDDELNRRQDAAVVEFIRGADIVVMEAQYTEEEYRQKKGWGHSTFDDAVSRSVRGAVKHLVLFHHDPTHTDEMMDDYLYYCRGLLQRQGSPLLCSAAREKVAITL